MLGFFFSIWEDKHSANVGYCARLETRPLKRYASVTIYERRTNDLGAFRLLLASQGTRNKKTLHIPFFSS